MRHLVRICTAGARSPRSPRSWRRWPRSAEGGQLKLTESPSAGFPDRAYLLALPQTRPLTASGLTVTENGGPVVGLGVQPPGGSSSGALLLIDASNSMEGAPIAGAMAAARAFLAERKDDLPVSVVVFGPDDTSPRSSRPTVRSCRPRSPRHPRSPRERTSTTPSSTWPRWRRTRSRAGRRSSSSRTAPTSAARQAVREALEALDEATFACSRSA